MVRSPRCDESSLKKGPWTPEEDQKLVDYISRHGHGCWRAIPKLAGLNRCGKSCRLRWTNYLRPDIKRGRFSDEEERIIINLHSVFGNKWSRIASHLPGRTDNEIKNFWNTHIRKKLLQMGVDPITHKPRNDLNNLLNLSRMIFSSSFGNLMASSGIPWNNALNKLQRDATQLAKIQLLQNLLQLIGNTNSSFFPNYENMNNSGLCGFQNLNPFDPNVLMAYTTLNPAGSSPQTTSDHEHKALTNSWSWLEGGFDMEGLVVSNNNNDLSLNSTSCHNIEEDNKLPPLILSSSENSTMSEMEKSSQLEQTHNWSTSSPISKTFEALEKFMNSDETDTVSFWKDILNSTWSSS